MKRNGLRIFVDIKHFGENYLQILGTEKGEEENFTKSNMTEGSLFDGDKPSTYKRECPNSLITYTLHVGLQPWQPYIRDSSFPW